MCSGFTLCVVGYSMGEHVMGLLIRSVDVGNE